MQKRIYIYLCCIILLNTLSFSQNIILNINGISETNQNNLIKSRTNHTDSLSALIHLEKSINQLINNGYAAAIKDSIIITNNIFNAYINQGSVYEWIDLKINNQNIRIFENAGIKKTLSNNKIFRYKDIKDLSKKVLTYLENNGYPYANFSLDSIEIIKYDNKIKATINIDKGPFLIIDSIKISSSIGISRKYIYNYIEIKPDDIYNQKKISQIDKKLKELDIIKLTSSTDINIVTELPVSKDVFSSL